MIKKLVEISFALLFTLTGLTSKAQTVEAISRLQPDSVLIGQQVQLEISLKIPADFEVDWPVWGDTLITGIEILKAGPLERETIDREGNIRLFQELSITSFDEGLYYIPGAELNFSPPSDSAFFTAQTNPLMLQVSTVVVDTTASFKPIKGPVGAPIGFWEVFPWIIGLLALALIAFLIYWYFRRRGSKEIPVPIISKPVIPPHIVALNKLEEIRLMKLWQAGRHKEYHSLLSETIREYIEARFKVNAVEMTTDEILAAIDLLGINREALAKLARALQLGDLVKFAKAEPAGLENDMCYSHLVDFVNESHGIQEAGTHQETETGDEAGSQIEMDKKVVTNMLNEITFAHPDLLYLLLLIPLMVVWYIFRQSKQQAYLQLSDASMLASGPKGIRVYLRHMLFAFRQLAIALLVVALARPQSSSTGQDVRIEGIDIVIALDVSGSMLARDIKPDRMEASKEVAREFIQGRPNDRMGLVIFSGETFTQVPLTTDRNVLLNMFEGIKSGMIEDGTAIGDGLATSVGRLRDSKAISKVIILLTDGANNAGSVDPLTAAEIARVFGIRVYTVGVGSYGLAPFPVQTPFGVQIRDIKADIDEPLLQEIANMTEGKYYRATDNKKFEEIFNEIDQLEKSKIDVTEFKRKYEEFLPLALLAFAFLFAEFVLRQTVFRTAI